MYKSSLIIPSNAAYYLNFFESLFLRFLHASGASKRTQENYKTDIRHFFVWLVSFLHDRGEILPRPEIRILETVTPETVDVFKTSLSIKQTPDATINRRLSSIRLFLKFCQDNQWIRDNPTESLRNIPKRRMRNKAIEETVGAFRNRLLAEGVSESHADAARNVVHDFLVWLEYHP